jgi:hypothetical protein
VHFVGFRKAISEVKIYLKVFYPFLDNLKCENKKLPILIKREVGWLFHNFLCYKTREKSTILKFSHSSLS